MGWSTVFQRTTAVLHYSSPPEPIQWIAFPPALNGCKQKVRGVVDEFYFLVISMSFVDVYSTQLNWEIIKQTHQTCFLLQSQSSGDRLSLNLLVHKQGEERQLRHASVLTSDRNSVKEIDERLGLSQTTFIFSKKNKKKTPVIPQRLWWANWMRVLTLIWRFCALMGNNFSKAACQTWSGFQNTPWSRNTSVYEKETGVQCFL